MAATGWIIIIGGIICLLIILTGSGRKKVLSPTELRVRRQKTAHSLTGFAFPIIAASVVVYAYGAPLLGLAAFMMVAVCVFSWRTSKGLKASMELADSVSGLATVLANQAAASSTVGDAVREAAPLVPGQVGDAAAQLSKDLTGKGTHEAVRRFTEAIDVSAAQWMGDIIVISNEGGGKWAGVVHILETEISDEADTLRLLRERAGSQLPQIIMVILMSSGLVISMGAVSREVGEWFLTSSGQFLLIGGGLVISFIVFRVASRIRGLMRI